MPDFTAGQFICLVFVIGIAVAGIIRAIRGDRSEKDQ